MKKTFLFAFSVLLLTSCATVKPPWPTDRFRPVEPFELVKKCSFEKDSRLLFFVVNPSENPNDDIFVKELVAGAGLNHETYGAVKIWLYYPEVSISNARVLPESPPSFVLIETAEGVKTINLKKKGSSEKSYELWKEFLTPNRLTFIENCVYGF